MPGDDHGPKASGSLRRRATSIEVAAIAGLVLVGASALAAPLVLVEVSGLAPDPGAVSLLRAMAAVVLAVFAPRVATLVMFSTASLSRRAGALPKWLIVVTYVVGVAEFVNVTIATPTLYVFPAWIALVSIVVLVRHPSTSTSSSTSVEP